MQSSPDQLTIKYQQLSADRQSIDKLLRDPNTDDTTVISLASKWNGQADSYNQQLRTAIRTGLVSLDYLDYLDLF